MRDNKKRVRVILVRVGNLNAYPPSISLLHALSDLGYEVVICTTLDSRGVEKSIPKEIKVEYINIVYAKTSLNKRISNMFWLKRQLLCAIDKYYNDESVVWLEDDPTIKHLVYEITKYNYIIRLDELNEELYLTQHFRYKLLSLDSSRIGNSAIAVVVPEYNRAHMMKVWWHLNELPFVLPNKPYCSQEIDVPEKPNLLPQQAMEVLEMIGEKKIILYQGKMHPERPVEPFIEAVQDLDDFTFVVNAGTSNGVEKKYRNCYHIGFVAPPFHLQITKKAYIGVVAYIPGIGTDSVLNALYCAPNKIFEYGLYGVPYISNDLPPLKSLCDIYKCGMIADISKVNDIREKLLMIDKDYGSFSENVKKMNESVDYKQLVEQLMDKVIDIIINGK